MGDERRSESETVSGQMAHRARTGRDEASNSNTLQPDMDTDTASQIQVLHIHPFITALYLLIQIL